MKTLREKLQNEKRRKNKPEKIRKMKSEEKKQEIQNTQKMGKVRQENERNIKLRTKFKIGYSMRSVGIQEASQQAKVVAQNKWSHPRDQGRRSGGKNKDSNLCGRMKFTRGKVFPLSRWWRRNVKLKT